MYTSSSGGFLSMLKGIKISSLLDGTSKTLSVINQAIPIIYQIKPLVGNVQSLFKISNMLKSNEVSDNTSKVMELPYDTKSDNNASPVFFV